MSGSRLIQEQRVGAWHEAILDTLQARFQSVPTDVRKQLSETRSERRLKQLHKTAVSCASVGDFQERLLK
jgi:hypothetical protein